MEIVFVWLLLAIGVGFLANSRGRSGFGFFLLSAIFSPLLGLIVVLVIANLNEVEAQERQKRIEDEAKERIRREEHERQLESIRAIATPQKAGPSQPTPVLGTSPSVADEIRKLAALRNDGLLTEEEFLQQKSLLLGTSHAVSAPAPVPLTSKPKSELVRNGVCPNCRSTIPDSSEKCPKCSADFGPGSAWKIESL